MKNADMPAMPTQTYDHGAAMQGLAVCVTDNPGLTKREVMAMHFHAALLSAHNEGEWSGVGCGAAEWAVKEADSLLAELERTK